MGKFNLRFFTGSEFLLFLFFLLVSCCLWLMLTLNKEYDTEITIPVHIKGIPDDAAFTSSGEEEIVVKVHDGGMTLMNYTFSSFLPISVDYEEFSKRDGRLSLAVSSLKKRIEGQLQSTTSLIAIQPDSFVYYTRESAVKLPVRLNGNYSTAHLYVAGEPLIQPDTVYLYAPQTVTDTLRGLFTQFFDIQELRDSLIMTLPLTLPQGCKCVPSDVRVTIPVSPFAEKSFELPVMGVGFPGGYALRTFPANVKVVMNVNMALYDSVSPSDFEVGVKYQNVADGSKARVPVELLSAPEWVQDVRVVPAEVEYLIERQ